MNPAPKTNHPASSRIGLRAIIVVYVIISSLHIVLDQHVLVSLVHDPRLLEILDAGNEAVFLIISAAMLYLAMRQLLRMQRQTLLAEAAAEDARARAESLLRSVVDAWPDSIFVKDRAGHYLLWNLGATRITGVGEAQMLGHDDSVAFPPEQLPMIRANDERVMVRGETETFEETIATVDGLRTFLATKGPLRDAEGRVFGMFGISHDITERKQAEQRITEQVDELLRWQDLMLGREERVQALKAEVNGLLAAQGQSARYASQEGA